MLKQILLMQTAGSGGISAVAGGVSSKVCTGFLVIVAIIIVLIVTRLTRSKPYR